MLLKLIEVVVLFVVLFIVITQIIIPLVQGRRAFPFLRDEKKLYDELNHVNEDISNAELKQEIDNKKQVLESMALGTRSNITPQSETKDDSQPK